MVLRFLLDAEEVTTILKEDCPFILEVWSKMQIQYFGNAGRAAGTATFHEL